jgi:acetamidase/formamidase
MNVISYRPDPSEFAWTFGGEPPVLKVNPGDVMELWTEDAFGGKVRGPDDVISKVIQFPFVNPQTGPFHVEGAEPGDTLAIHFVSIEPSRDWGASTLVPLFGALSSTHQTVTLQDPLPEFVWIYEVDRTKRTVRYQARAGDHSVDLPLDPMHGTVGVAPANMEARLSLVPDAYGGNMDTPEMRAGATCYLGVNVEGAMFSLGDGHARQGEGETCGVAVEAAMDTVITIDLIKDRTTPWPRLRATARGRVPYRARGDGRVAVRGVPVRKARRVPVPHAGVGEPPRERMRPELHVPGESAEAVPPARGCVQRHAREAEGDRRGVHEGSLR